MVYLCVTISVLSTYLIISNKDIIARILKIYDNPNSERKLHIEPVPAIGGTALIFTLIVFYFLSIVLDITNLLIYSNSIIFFIISYLIGLFDDKQKLYINYRIILIIINYFLILSIEPSLLITKIYINNPNLVIQVDNFLISLIITIFCIFLLYNSINFLDGVNGNLILLTIYWIIIFFVKSNLFSNLALITVSSLIICLIHNLRNKIFMGNSGSLLISSIIAYLFLLSHGNEYRVFFSDEIVVLFLIPGLDIMRLFFLRLKNKRSPFDGDQNHLHHLLLRKYKKNRIFIYYLIISVIPYGLYTLLNINIFLLITIILIYYLFLIKLLSGFSYNNKIL
ncbi:undecaprenyl/decaprenyl-phosphate alpha-N-acetylglucosaminyl 1-phosphate transferase [Candidatus Pelagibacter ubique]|nr:undecaprenyl/decaprenyl-phosphate alpha-N-acetylglucosaminyl 1-phosphate transferase [Candidatus Pelagibacter ubique]